MRIQDFTGRLLGKFAYSQWFPGRQETGRSFVEGMNYRRNFFNLSRARQDVEVLKTLQQTVRKARQDVPYYAEKLRDFPAAFPQSFAEYSALPTLDKATIRDQKKDLISREFNLSELIACSTSGSTGEPIVVYSSKKDVGWRLSGEQYYNEILGCPRGTRLGKFYGGELDINSKSRLRQLKNWAFNCLQLDCLRLDEKYLLEVHARLTKFSPDMLVAYSSAIYLLALTLQRNSLHPNYPAQVIVAAAERLEKYQREVIENVFGLPVVERYGSRDVGQMAYQMPGNQKEMQIDRAYCLLEPDGEPDENGLAPILVTTLRNQAMPLLRYRIEDLACFPNDEKSSGTVTSLGEVVGRTLDYISLPDQRKIFGGMLGLLFQNKDILAYQVIQNADSSVQIKIVPGPNLTKDERKTMQLTMQENLRGLRLEFEYPMMIERSTATAKLRPVISYFEPAGLGK